MHPACWPGAAPAHSTLQLGRGAEGVVEGAIDDGVEPAVQPVERGGVADLEVHRHPRLTRVVPSPLDGRDRPVDPGGRISLGGVVDRVVPGPGARVEHLTSDRAQRNQLLNHRLGTPDVPWRGGRQPVGDPIIAIHLLEPGGIGRIELGRHGSECTNCSTGTRGPVKNGVSARVWRRASVARSSRIRSTMRSSSGASNARIHS